jgi:ribosome biogenesis GTPase
MKHTLEATVVKNAGSHFLLSPLPEWKPFPAVLRGKVRLTGSGSTNPVAVGDRVVCEYEEHPSETAPAIIKEILERHNHLVRRSTNLSRRSHVIAANLDRAVIVVTLYFPEIKLPFLDRILVSCEAYGVKPLIVLNKLDLYGAEAADEVENFRHIYEGAGYKVIGTSVKTGEGIDELRSECSDGLSLLTGESGVGKSSLVKALDPSLSPKTGELSVVHLQGCHTTSLYEMYPLSCGGFMIDTPGLRGFGLSGVEAEEAASYFPEMLRVADRCRFIPCTHTHEPGCAVKEALDRGEISPERYNSYLGMLEEDGKFR